MGDLRALRNHHPALMKIIIPDYKSVAVLQTAVFLLALQKKKLLILIKVSFTNSYLLNQPNIWVILLESIHVARSSNKESKIYFSKLLLNHASV